MPRYSVAEGLSAEGIIGPNDQNEPKAKFLCMSGVVAYTLLGRKAGLPVKGYTVPGHAFTVLQLGNRKYQVDTVHNPEEPKEPCMSILCDYTGTEVPPSAAEEWEPGLRLTVGTREHDPEEFVALNYGNVAVLAFETLLVTPKYEGGCTRSSKKLGSR